ncbi:senescence-specific cysteine protease SAG39-like [Ananas comosus]|uniref:Senescence-specific cysteine protease SAG39-like n=1 Tax=Ananas comosus TaxID=4615 RepID=A0A6P5FFL5_ANACO|nr:senescence-specific cysteine protease SAG39-like [Ananas comosus]XP_020094761.1 senescence-specific cysteine protease SAG39-like [Ananas comosus]XP_020094762.1 senescence-specific cysteine protease SAG39-like [Ananas comosus]XP_020094763.1 senescence-specific cysteine protease SAG39-like [Ananas comosus]
MATTVKNSSSQLSDETLRLIHQNWMRRYDFEYEDEEEEEKRFKIFKATFEEIEKYNTEEEAPLLILSRYSDLTDAEFFALRSTIQGELPKDMRDDVSLRPHRQEDCDACVLHKRGRKS